MKLADWLKREGRDLEWLGAELGVTTASASRITRGIQNVPMSTLARIDELTGGEVTPNDMVQAQREALGEADAA